MNKSSRNREAKTCKHFNGIGFGNKEDKQKVCKAGINYRELVGGDDFGWVLGLPCIPHSGEKRVVVPCMKREFYIQAEIEQREKELDDYMSNAFEAMVLCRKDAAGKRNISGSVVCPVCKAELDYRVHNNGHMWGKCKTDGCVSWME